MDLYINDNTINATTLNNIINDIDENLINEAGIEITENDISFLRKIERLTILEIFEHFNIGDPLKLLEDNPKRYFAIVIYIYEVAKHFVDTKDESDYVSDRINFYLSEYQSM